MKEKTEDKCPKCGKRMFFLFYADRRYFVYDDDIGKVIEICKKCYDKRKVHRMCTRVKGKTIVID